MRHKRRVRECWVWWHAEEPCSEKHSALKNLGAFDWHPDCAYSKPGRWVLMREVRRRPAHPKSR